MKNLTLLPFLIFLCVISGNGISQNIDKPSGESKERRYRLEIDLQDKREELRREKSILEINRSISGLIDKAILKADQSSYPKKIENEVSSIKDLTSDDVDQNKINVISKKADSIVSDFYMSLPRLSKLLDDDDDSLQPAEKKVLRSLLATQNGLDEAEEYTALRIKMLFNEEEYAEKFFPNYPESTTASEEAVNNFISDYSAESFIKKKNEVMASLKAMKIEMESKIKSSEENISTINKAIDSLLDKIEKTRESEGFTDKALVFGALPALGILMIGLLLTPAVYKDPNLHSEVFKSGLLLELFTVFFITSCILVLGLGQRLDSPILGTLLGGVSGYVLGRTGSKERRDSAGT